MAVLAIRVQFITRYTGHRWLYLDSFVVSIMLVCVQRRMVLMGQELGNSPWPTMDEERCTTLDPACSNLRTVGIHSSSHAQRKYLAILLTATYTLPDEYERQGRLPKESRIHRSALELAGIVGPVDPVLRKDLLRAQETLNSKS